MFKKDSAKVNNQQQETYKVPSYGNMKIDEAKGKMEMTMKAIWSKSSVKPTWQLLKSKPTRTKPKTNAASRKKSRDASARTKFKTKWSLHTRRT